MILFIFDNYKLKLINWRSNSLFLGKARPHNNQGRFSGIINDTFIPTISQIYPNTTCFNILKFCPSVALVGFAEFVLSCSEDLSCFFDILVGFNDELAVA